MLSKKDIAKALGFTPKENTSGVFQKKYTNYAIEINFEKETFDFGSKIKAESKTTQNFSQEENWVVLECVNRLLEKGYPPQNIILEKTWKTGHGTSGRIDILVTRDDGSAYLMIECKTWGTEFDKEFKNLKKNGGQLFTYFQQDKNADVLVLYASDLDSKEIKYINEIVKIEEDYRQTANVPDFYDRWNKLPKSNGVFDNWCVTYNYESKALTPDDLNDITEEDSSRIFNQFLEILRHNVVSDKGNAFNKIFTLFLCKIYDEKFTHPNEELKFQWLEGKDDHVDFQKRLTDLYKLGMEEFLDKEVTDLSDEDFENKYGVLISDEDAKQKLLKEFTKIRLEKNNEFAIKEVFDTSSFNENAKVVKEVVELLQGFKIRYTKKQQYLSDFFELLLTTGLKQESGQFFTPVPIAQFIIKSIPLDKKIEEKLKAGKKNDLLPTVIDYASGSGHFLTESMHEIQKVISNINPDDYITSTRDKLKAWKENHFDWAYRYIYGIEKDYRLVKVGKVGCYLHGDGLAKVIHSDGLANFAKNVEYKEKLRETDKEYPQDNSTFDIVVSNPPYSVSSFKNNARKYYTEADFTLYNRLTDSSSEIECLFIERTKQLLKAGGIAGIVLPSSILSNTGIYSETRELILRYFDIVGIAELGSNTFMATGTNTVVLFLRRRDNYYIQNLEIKVQRAFDDAKDVAIEKIENVFSTYINHVWEGISFDDYKTLLLKTPNEAVEQHEIYQEYKKKIKSKNDEDLLDSILDVEQDKLLYFIIASSQKIVLINTGSKNEEKRFLGYEFSNRRGSEGIHPIQRGKSIDECTQLYDADTFTNIEKASTYVYKAFNGEFDLEIPDSLTKNISYRSLVDMLTFDRVDFEKNISLSAKKKVKIESQWDQIKIGNLSQLIKRGKSAKYGKSAIQIIKSGQARGLKEYDFSVKHFVEEKFTLDERQLQKGDLLINSSGVGTAGRVTLFTLDGTYVADSHITIVRLNEEVIIPDFALACFAKIGFKTLESLAMGQSGQIEMTIPTIENIKIPIPPKHIQQKIVAEIEKLERHEVKSIEEVKKLRVDISQVILKSTGDLIKLEDITSKIGSGSTPRGGKGSYHSSGISLIRSQNIYDHGFVEKGLAFINESQAKKLDVVKIEKNDVLFNITGASIARCCIVEDKYLPARVNQHVSIIRANNKALPKYIHATLTSEEFKAKLLEIGDGGTSRQAITKLQLEEFKIPVPPLAEQKKIVSEIEKLEKKIDKLQVQIDSMPEQKETVLKKYL